MTSGPDPQRRGPDRPRGAAEALEALNATEGIRDRLRRVRLTAIPIAQAAVAAALAWLVATSPLIDHDQPFFAPIAALISVGVGLGQKLQRVVELVVGVALGVLVGDLLVGLIGVGVVQIAAVVALAMVVAVFLGGGAVIVTQAAASAVLVVTLLSPREDEAINLDRFVDAAVGGVVGLARIAPVRWRAKGKLVGYLDAAEPEEARASAVAAAELATEALDQTGGFAGQVVVAQVRSMAVDVLRATGLDRDQAAGLLPGLPSGPVSYG